MNSNLLHPEDGSSAANQGPFAGTRQSIPNNEKRRGGQILTSSPLGKVKEGY